MTIEARPGEAGFSIVELLLGTVLLVVGLGGVMTSTMRLHGLRRLDGEIGLAYAACRSNLEELRTVPLASLPAMDGRGFDVLGPGGQTAGLRAVRGDADRLPGEIHVALDQSAAGRMLYRIRVLVQWAGASQRHSVELSTLRGGMP